MSQTSSPTLLYNLGSSINAVTSGAGRESFAFNLHSVPRKILTLSSPTERSLEQSFTPFLFYSVDRASDQGILPNNLLFHLYLDVATRYSNNILFQSWNFELARMSEIPDHRSGVDISTLLGKQDNRRLSQSPHFEIIRWIRTKTGLSQDRIARLLGVTRQTLYNWEKGEPILDYNRQRLLQVKDVLERIAPQHPTPASLATWLDTPRGAEGYTPSQLFERNEIGKARLFALSNPSSHLKRAQPWVRRSVPEVFKSGEEHYDEVLPPNSAGDSTALEDSEGIEDLIRLENDVDYDGGKNITL